RLPACRDCNKVRPSSHSVVTVVHKEKRMRVLSAHSVMAITATLVVSFAVAQALVLSAHKHGHLTMDLPGAVQKFHSLPTPRVGGIAIYVAVTAAWMLLPGVAEAKLLGTVLLAGMPALLVGLLEDVTKRVSVRTRLLVTM